MGLSVFKIYMLNIRIFKWLISNNPQWFTTIAIKSNSMLYNVYMMSTSNNLSIFFCNKTGDKFKGFTLKCRVARETTLSMLYTQLNTRGQHTQIKSNKQLDGMTDWPLLMKAKCAEKFYCNIFRT